MKQGDRKRKWLITKYLQKTSNEKKKKKKRDN